MTDQATINTMTRRKGIAGQFAIAVSVSYPDEPASDLAFVGSIYGGPIVMVTPGNPQGQFVDNPGRFGVFLNEEWVRGFFGVDA